MGKIDTGGDAYPIVRGGETKNDVGDLERHKSFIIPGMTLLDYFAGQALASWLNESEKLVAVVLEGKKQEEIISIIAETVYNIAAAMIAEKRRLEAE